MPVYSVRVLDMGVYRDGPRNHIFLMESANYGEAVIAVGLYLELEQIPYRCFGGSRDLGR